MFFTPFFVAPARLRPTSCLLSLPMAIMDLFTDLVDRSILIKDLLKGSWFDNTPSGPITPNYGVLRHGPGTRRYADLDTEYYNGE